MGQSTEVYSHHGVMVSVRSRLKGRHREFCLCYDCGRFTPEDRLHNCRIANVLYEVCCLAGVVTPVWECPKFRERRNDGSSSDGVSDNGRWPGV